MQDLPLHETRQVPLHPAALSYEVFSLMQGGHYGKHNLLPSVKRLVMALSSAVCFWLGLNGC